MTTPVTVFDYEELTLRDNVEAYRRWQLRPRLLIDAETCTTAARARALAAAGGDSRVGRRSG